MPPGDRDVFAFSLESAGNVELQSEGAAGTAGQLFDETGTLLVAENGGRSGSGFRISAALPAGRYFVRVESANSARAPIRFTAIHLSRAETRSAEAVLECTTAVHC